MLFHITHQHDEHTCPARDDATAARTFGALAENLAEHVNEVIGMWGDPLSHTLFAVVDADEATQIIQGFFPIIDAGTAQVRPIVSMDTVMAVRDEMAG